MGGRISFRPPAGLSIEVPLEAEARLLPLLREFKPDILALLGPRPPEGPCPAGHPAYWWRPCDSEPWRCGRGEPDPRAELWPGATMADLGGRAITLIAPAGRPAIREWVQTPAGWATVLAYAGGGAECFVRLLKPPAGRRPFLWFPVARLVSEAAPGGTGREGAAAAQQGASQ